MWTATVDLLHCFEGEKTEEREEEEEKHVQDGQKRDDGNRENDLLNS